MISAICILNRSGDILAIRKYRNDFDSTALEDFRICYVAAKELQSPATLVDQISFLHYYHEEIYYVAITRQNPNAATIFEFLSKLPIVIQTILNLNSMDQDVLKKNSADIIELLDEMIDSGYPQTTDIQVLRLLTRRRPPSTTMDISNNQVTIAATGAISWRPPNIYHRENEILVDIGERISALISSDGKILDAVVDGNIILKVALSGMPECKMGFNDKVSLVTERKEFNPVIGSPKNIEVDDIAFHQCVKSSNFHNDKAITFIPPDGEFELMRYRRTNDIQIPFIITPMVRDIKGVLEVTIVVKANFEPKLTAHPFLLSIPLPSNTSKVKSLTSQGEAKYITKKNAIVWRIGHFVGGTQAEIKSLVTCLSSITKNDSSTKLTEPLSAEFSIVMYSATGLSLRYLTIVEKSNYHIDRYIRYRTMAGKFEVRVI